MTGAAVPGLVVRGAPVFPGHLDRAAQEALIADLRGVAMRAPFVRPVTPGGRPMSVRMTAAGRLGWIADRRGYRYSPTHPNGQAWPAIPDRVLAIWDALSGTATPPDCCLINLYDATARMGLHQDRDEGDFDFPVLSISLGDEARFRIGGTERGGGTESFWLRSGDVMLLTGPSRLAWHGVDRIRHRSSTLLSAGGRINLTLRVVRRPDR